MDTEMGVFWKAKMEKLYEEQGNMEVVFFPHKDEAKFEEGSKELKLTERTAHREARRQMEGQVEDQVTGDGSSHVGFHEQLVANS
jgi:large subunit ribosomal protein L28